MIFVPKVKYDRHLRKEDANNSTRVHITGLVETGPVKTLPTTPIDDSRAGMGSESSKAGELILTTKPIYELIREVERLKQLLSIGTEAEEQQAKEISRLKKLIVDHGLSDPETLSLELQPLVDSETPTKNPIEDAHESKKM